MRLLCPSGTKLKKKFDSLRRPSKIPDTANNREIDFHLTEFIDKKSMNMAMPKDKDTRPKVRSHVQSFEKFFGEEEILLSLSVFIFPSVYLPSSLSPNFNPLPYADGISKNSSK